MCQLRLLPSLITSSWIKNSALRILPCVTPGYPLEAPHGAEPGWGNRRAAPAARDGRWGCACPSHLCFSWGEGMKSKAIRDFPVSSKRRKPQIPHPHNAALRVGTVVSVGFRPFPGRASEGRGLVPALAPALAASQQDECRFGSQAGGNPRSLLWLCAPADLEPGFAVIPTSCCRSLISWSQPGKKKERKKESNKPKVLWLKPPLPGGGEECAAALWAPAGRLGVLGEIAAHLLGMEAEKRVSVCFCWGSQQDPRVPLQRGWGQV